jgi:Fic family protein
MEWLEPQDFSTRIEGNRLTHEQAEQVVATQYFHGRERDEAEVKGYYAAAIHELEATVARKGKVTELTIQTLHALVMGSGKKRLCPSCGRNHRSD